MNTPSSNPRSTLIVGAGPVGLCAARALTALGLEVELVESQPDNILAEPAFDGREIALTHRSMRILQQLNVWRHISPSAVHPLRRAQVADKGYKAFDVAPDRFGRDRLGNLVANHVIRTAAWQAVVDDPAIRIHAGVKVETAERYGDTFNVRLADGRYLATPLLVVADGRFSAIRRLLGVPVVMHDFGKTMLVCRMRHEQPHGGIAREWFGRAQTRALLPLDEHTVSIVLTVTGHEAAALQELSEDAFAHVIEARLEQCLGSMQLASTRHAYPLVATWAGRFAGPGFALVGDAAVGMHPVTAHGFNLGVDSVARLAAAVGRSLTRHGTPAHASALARYQRQHRAGALPLFIGTNMVAGLFTDDRPPVQPLRHAVMGSMRHLQPLRDALAATAVDAPPLDPHPGERLWRRVRQQLPAASDLG